MRKTYTFGERAMLLGISPDRFHQETGHTLFLFANKRASVDTSPICNSIDAYLRERESGLPRQEPIEEEKPVIEKEPDTAKEVFRCIDVLTRYCRACGLDLTITMKSKN